MKILLLTQVFPYPPDSGPKVKTWNVIRYLAGQGHAITLVSFVRMDELQENQAASGVVVLKNQQAVEAVARVCKAVHLVPIRRIRWKEPFYWLRSVWKRAPFLIERDDRA